MTDEHSNRGDGQRRDPFRGGVGRRAFLAAGSGASVAMFAGCTSGGSPAGSNDGTQSDESGGAGQDGTFRLLISDMPADIGDFDRLDVTFDYARIFDGGDEDSKDDVDEDEAGNGGDIEDEGEDEDESPDEDEAEDENEDDEGKPAEEDDADTESDDVADADESTENEDEPSEDDESDDLERSRGFYRLDLEGATVDLTEVIGEKAKPVFEGTLSPGTYEKVELHVSEVEGVVDGEPAAVKVPSEKLQITHPFEVGTDEPVAFVFDINVVKRGPQNGYNLKPVISESGVAGKDVDVEEVTDDADDEAESAEADDGERNEDDGDGGKPDEDGKDRSDGGGDE